mgnify:CR=1 FL=1
MKKEYKIKFGAANVSSWIYLFELIAWTYCKKEIWPNLKCKLDKPIIIFSLFNMSIYGRWYKPASGRYTLLLLISKKRIIDDSKQKIKYFLFK